MPPKVLYFRNQISGFPLFATGIISMNSRSSWSVICIHLSREFSVGIWEFLTSARA